MGRRRRAKEAAAEQAAWQAELERLQWFVNRAEQAPGSTNAEDASIPVALHQGEHALLVLQGVDLLEPRRLPGQWTGGPNTFAFHVARRANSGPGATDGNTGGSDLTFMPLDTGSVTITDRRVVFNGGREAREWDFQQALGYHNYDDPPWTAIPVGGRDKISGVRYPSEAAEGFRFALALGMARARGGADSLIADLRGQLAEVESERPAGVAGAATVAAAAVAGTEPTVAQPVVAQPVAVQPVAVQPVAVQPVAAQPVVAQPVVAQPIAAQPVVAQPVVAQPVVAQPIAAQPVGAQPVVAQPVVAQPVAAQPVAAQPVAAQPVAAQPVAAEPVAAEPEPVAAQPVASQPVAAEPVAAEPVAAEPVAAQAAATGAGSTEAEPAGQLPPPGWYPDPYGTARLRWWDGQTWTSHDAP
jgi:Protein of unknown function (DUF2510)/Keratin, high sulfur B2 protein